MHYVMHLAIAIESLDGQPAPGVGLTTRIPEAAALKLKHSRTKECRIVIEEVNEFYMPAAPAPIEDIRGI